MSDTDYIPYGEEWKKEISKLPKAAIIEMAAKLGQEKDLFESKALKWDSLVQGLENIVKYK